MCSDLPPPAMQQQGGQARARRYVEVHIEQGLTLEGLDVPVAPVRAIAGQTRLSVMFKGVQVRRPNLAHSHAHTLDSVRNSSFRMLCSRDCGISREM